MKNVLQNVEMSEPFHAFFKGKKYQEKYVSR